MSTTLRMLSMVLLLGGCANLPAGDGGVVALEVTTPGSLVLGAGQTIQLEARALDRNGEVVADAPITWATPDTTISVEAATGLVTAVDSSGTGRVQAAVGTLRSDLITFTLQPASGT